MHGLETIKKLNDEAVAKSETTGIYIAKKSLKRLGDGLIDAGSKGQIVTSAQAKELGALLNEICEKL